MSILNNRAQRAGPEPVLLTERSAVLNRAHAYLLVRVALDLAALILVFILSPAPGYFPTYLVLLTDLVGLAIYSLTVRRWPALSVYAQLVFTGLLIIAIDYGLGQVTVIPWLALIPLGIAGGLIIIRPGFNSLVTISVLATFGLYVGSLAFGRNPLSLTLPTALTFSLTIALGVVLITLNVLVETLVIHLYQAEARLVQAQVSLLQTQTELAQSRDQLYDVQRDTRRTERLSAIGQIASQVSKSLRAPLVAVERTLAQPPAAPAPPETLAALRADIQTAHHVLDGLEQFASLGQMHTQTINLEDLLIAEIATLSPPPGVAIHIDKPPILSPLQADPNHVRLLARHLLANALEAVGDNGSITATLTPAPEGIHLAISDTGPGIAPERIGRLFEPLYTSKPQGLGLGLAICQQVVRMQGGRIQIQSALGHGATVSIYLPRLPRNPPEELAQDIAG